MAATLEDAIRQAIKMYFEKNDDFGKLESQKERKYTKKYFDSVKEEMLGEKSVNKDHEKDSKPDKGKGLKY